MAMIKTEIRRNSTNLKLAVIVLSVVAISCTAIREFTNRPSEKVRKLNESVPAGILAAERDHRIHELSSFRIVLPEPGQILLGDADGVPIDLGSLDAQLETLYSTTTPDRRVVYLIAAANIPTSEVAAVLDKVREHDINIVKLVTSSRSPDENDGFLTSVPPPDRAIEVVVRKEAMTNKPNPLTLLVTTGPDGSPLLNNESILDRDGLTNRLREIAKLREQNGVFRESTDEVEMTVLIDVPRADPDQKYGDVVALVDAVKLAGARPIVLGDKDKFIQMPEDPHYDLRELIPRHPIPVKDPPKVISGGVLNGKATNLPKPSYPPAARAVRASGSVNVRVTVSEDGKVIEANAVSGHPLLRSAAVSAARSAEFSPTLLAGRPVKVTGVLIYNFVPPEQ
ncbi:MAG: TonB family protein [Pyrinomonadaceae bacterium]